MGFRVGLGGLLGGGGVATGDVEEEGVDSVGGAGREHGFTPAPAGMEQQQEDEEVQGGGRCDRGEDRREDRRGDLGGEGVGRDGQGRGHG